MLILISDLLHDVIHCITVTSNDKNINFSSLFYKVGDQSAAMFGECCFDVGDIKCTMGTGMFIDLNTGNKPHASVAGKDYNNLS